MAQSQKSANVKHISHEYTTGPYRAIGPQWHISRVKPHVLAVWPTLGPRGSPPGAEGPAGRARLLPSPLLTFRLGRRRWPPHAPFPPRKAIGGGPKERERQAVSHRADPLRPPDELA